MPDWDAIQAGLRYWFAAVSGIGLDDVVWEGVPLGHRNPRNADLQLTAWARDVGTDETRYETLPAGWLRETVVGGRTVRLVCTVRSSDQHLSARAEPALEGVRSELETNATQAMLAALGLAVRESSPIVTLSEEVDGREISCASMSVVLGYTVCHASRLSAPVATIERVQLSGTVNAEPQPERTVPSS